MSKYASIFVNHGVFGKGVVIDYLEAEERLKKLLLFKSDIR